MNRLSIVALAVFILSVVLVLTMRTATAQRLQASVLELVRPIHTTTSSTASRIEEYRKGLKTLDELEAEVQHLRVENDQLRATNGVMNGTAAENNKLREALGFKQRSNFNLIAARIISRSASSWWSTVQIDRGEADGLDSDMPVVTDQGLVGKTTTVAANTAFVMLITDENCKVSAYVEGAGDLPAEAREKGLVSGERLADIGSPEMSLNFLPKTSQIAPGEKVYSFGVAGGVFPRGLLLGAIKEVQTRALDVRATVAPAVDLARLENVFIVRGMRGAEPTPAATPPPAAASVTPARVPSPNPNPTPTPAPGPTVRAALPVAPAATARRP